MSDYKLFKFDWKIAWIKIYYGLFISMATIGVIYGYNKSIFNFSHIILLCIAIMYWVLYVVKDH